MHFYNYFVSLKSLVTDGWLIHEDPEHKDFFGILVAEGIISTRHGRHSFIRPGCCGLPCGRSGISASWTGRDDDAEVIDQAEEHGMMISLETHNPKNVAFYEHLGFKDIQGG